MKKLLVVTGPTATGKTALGLELAREFSGEIISADSRQVYKYMDIGTGKDFDKSKIKNQKSKLQLKNKKISTDFYELRGVSIWGLDIVAPDYLFNVADWVDYANLVIEDIWKRGKLPIIVGGTGQYIRSLLYPPETLYVPHNEELREQLFSNSVTQLQQKLKDQDPKKWELMNESDRQNSRRLVRAIEVGVYKSVILASEGVYQPVRPGERPESLIIGLTAPSKILYQRIDERVNKRVEQGITAEIKMLLEKGYSWDLPSMSGMGYREFRNYELGIRNQELGKNELEKIVQHWRDDEHRYARRQMTYHKKYFPQAVWFEVGDDDIEKINTLVALWNS